MINLKYKIITYNLGGEESDVVGGSAYMHIFFICPASLCLWLVHLIHLHLRLLSICMILLKVNVLVTQSYLTLCDPMDPLGSSVHGILQARILEWVAISYYHFLNCFGFIFYRSFPSIVFLAWRNSFSICKAGLMVLNSLNFCLSVKLLSSPSNLNENLSG